MLEWTLALIIGCIIIISFWCGMMGVFSIVYDRFIANDRTKIFKPVSLNLFLVDKNKKVKVKKVFPGSPESIRMNYYAK